MATEYKTIYAEKPGGILPFTVNDESKLLSVWPSEIFCRFQYEDGEMCGNKTKFDSANSLRLHIKNKHGEKLCHKFVKPNDTVIRAANADFKNCHEAIVAFDLKLRQAAAAHINIAIPKAPKKRKRKGRQEARVEESEEENGEDEQSLVEENTKEKQEKRRKFRLTRPKSTPDAEINEENVLEDEKFDPADKKFVKMVKVVKSFNLSAMRKAVGLNGKKCAFCASSKNSACPPINAQNWETHGCLVLAKFVQPEDEDGE